jgi:hypothetical protein
MMIEDGLTTLFFDLKGLVLHVAQKFRIIHFATDQSLGVKYGIFRIGVKGVCSGITNTK